MYMQITVHANACHLRGSPTYTLHMYAVLSHVRPGSMAWQYLCVTKTGTVYNRIV